MQQRLIGVRFQRSLAAATWGLIGGDDDLGVRSVDPCAQSIGRETGEHDRVDGTDARTGEHGVGSFGDHREIQNHTVAFADAKILKNVGHAAHALVQLLIGNVLRVFRGVIRLEDNRGLVTARLKVTIHAVGGDVQRAVFKPFDVDLAEFVGRIFYLGVGLDPVEAKTMFPPECVGVVDGSLIHFGVFCSVNMGRFRKFCGNWINWCLVCCLCVSRHDALPFDLS